MGFGKLLICAGALLVWLDGTPATAAIRDAVYRGTLVCDKLPFTEAKMREAIEVTVSGETATYAHVVRLRADVPEAASERGVGKITGESIELQGNWKREGREYVAAYRGKFVRRSAKLSGSQTWNDNGRQVVRECSGVIKRPLAPFLPRKKNAPAS